MKLNQLKSPARVKIIAAGVGAAALIAGATITVGVASADTPFVIKSGASTSTTLAPVDPAEPRPESGSKIDAVSTTPTTTGFATPN